ncbi:MAG: DUF4019 domain-containing protein [Kiritimatiellales bacterium]
MNKALGLMLSVLMMAGAILAGATDDKEILAINAGQQWLSLCDQANYAGSWDAAATYFKNAVRKEQWEQMAAAVRAPLGSVEKREVKSQSYKTSLPGAPDGEYVIVQFNTVFENKKAAVETVTMMLNQDRGWRVSGYFVK